MTRFLVTGSRSWTDLHTIRESLQLVHLRYGGLTLMHGGARGADSMAARIWASLEHPIEEYPADWETHGKRAGYVRNHAMVNMAPVFCLAFLHGDSRGTKMTIDLCHKAHVPTTVYRERPTPNALETHPSLPDGLVLP